MTTIDSTPTQESRRRWFGRPTHESLDPAQIEAATSALIKREDELAAARRRRELEDIAHREEVARRREALAKVDNTRKSERRAAVAAWCVAVLPILLVNAVAVAGQLHYGYFELAASHFAEYPTPVKIALAAVYGLASETVALAVGWYAHAALLERQYRAAATLRRASYLFAGVIAGVNYSHFTDNLEPNGAAIFFALCSVASPWLWGLHSRRKKNIQLIAENPAAVDTEGVQFSSERRRHFPIRTWRAARFALDHGITEPLEAWRRYNDSRPAPWWRRRSETPAGEPVRAELTVESVAPARESTREPIRESARAAISAPAESARESRGGSDRAPRRPAAPAQRAAAVRPAAPADEPVDAPAESGDESPVDIRQAYETFVAANGRAPSGAELGVAAGVSKATANRWKAENLTAAAA